MAKNIYEDFLRLTGFEEDEMSEYLPQWRKASEKLGLPRTILNLLSKSSFLPTLP